MYRIINAVDYNHNQPWALIYSSWMNTHCRSSQARAIFNLSASRHLTRYDPVGASVERTFKSGALYFLLERSFISRMEREASWWFAVDEEDGETVLGWLCAVGDTLHYVAVKPHMHRCGIASALVRHAFQPGEVKCSHWTGEMGMLSVDGYSFTGE